MNILSEKLALVLIEYNELPQDIQKCVDYYREEKEFTQMKGLLRLFEIDEKYLYVIPDLFDKSLLKSIYGTRIDRTNEDSFDTLLYYYFTLFSNVGYIKITEDLMTQYIRGMEVYAEENRMENLWHILNLSKQCIKDSYEPNFSALLSFYSVVELLVLKDISERSNGNKIHNECGRKLPYFYKNINLLNFPQQVYLNSKLSEKEIFENITFLRHKVIHGVFDEARNRLEKLFPISNNNVRYMGSTEDAESSAFQDQIQNLNSLIRSILYQILDRWMISPEQLSIIKNDLNFQA